MHLSAGFLLCTALLVVVNAAEITMIHQDIDHIENPLLKKVFTKIFYPKNHRFGNITNITASIISPRNGAETTVNLGDGDSDFADVTIISDQPIKKLTYDIKLYGIKN